MRNQESVAEATVDTESFKPLRLSGSQPFTQQPGVYIMIGERTNVAGSPKFARLIKEGKFEDAVSIVRQQVENGANVLDICMDEGMIDGVVNGVGSQSKGIGDWLRLLQSGSIRSYATWVALGSVALLLAMGLAAGVVR